MIPSTLARKAQVQRSEVLRSKSPILTFSPHPLIPDWDKELIYAVLGVNEDLESYLRRSGILAKMRNQPFVVMINGYRVPRELWSRCYPKVGTIINVCAVVRGGSGGKDDNKIPRTVFSIAIVVLAYMFFGPGGTFAAGLGQTGAAIAFAGTAIAGQFIATSLFPLPKPKSRDDTQASPTYGVDGGSNSIRRYEPMVKICGTNRVFPDYGTQPYTEFIGEDQVAYYVFDFGYNDIDISDMKIGDTPLSSFTSGVITEVSDVTGALHLFPGNVDSVAGSELTPTTGPIIRTSGANATALAVELAGSLFGVNSQGDLVAKTFQITIEYSPAGQNQWTTLTVVLDPGAQQWQDVVNSGGSGLGRIFADLFLMQINIPGVISIVSKTRQPFKRTYKWYVTSGQYDVRVTRLTPDDHDTKGDSTVLWTQLRTYQPDDADYTGRKRVALRITASGQLNGHVQQFNCIAAAKCPVWIGLSDRAKVPQFMPNLCGMGWSGSTVDDNVYVTQVTSNPAWWYLDTIRGRFAGKAANAVNPYMPYLTGVPWGGQRKVYGAGQNDVRTDLENIKAFGAWCDQQGLTFNFVFDNQQSVFAVLQTIALSGRGSPSWGTSKLGVVWDAPNLPVTAVFGMHNILLGTFEVMYASENPPDVIEGEFINPLPPLNWQKDFVRVQVPGQTTQNNVKRVPLIGRNSIALAAEDTNLYAAQVAYRNRRYKWQSEWEGFPCSRGDVIQLAHDLASLDYSGRFVEGGSDILLKLPRQVPLYVGGGFVVIVRPDGSSGAYPVKGGTGSTDTLVPVSPLPFNPWMSNKWTPYDYRWHYGSTATPGKKLKIEGVRPVNERTVELSCVDELDYFYTAKNNPYTYVPPDTLFGDLSINSVTVTPDGVRAGTGYVVVVTIAWDVEGDYDHADLLVGVDDTPPTIVAQNSRARSAQLTIIDGSTLAIKLTVFSSIGVLGKTDIFELTETINFTGLHAPADVLEFSLAGDQFNWTLVGDVDVVGYQIRFYYGTNSSWDTAAPLHEGLLAVSPWVPTSLPTGQGPTSFLIKAVDAGGNYSENPAIIVKDLGDTAVDNVYVIYDLRAAGWKGTLVGGTIDGNSHLIADSSTLQWKAAGGSAMWSSDGSTPEWAVPSYIVMTYEDSVSIPLAFEGYNIVLDFVAEGSPVTVEYRDNTNSVMWDDDLDSDMMWLNSTGPAVPAFMAGYEGLMWNVDVVTDVPAYMPYLLGTDWDYMWSPFSDYKPWTGPVPAQSTLYEFRITTGQSLVQGEIDAMRVLIDVPDVRQRVSLLTVPPEGLRVVLTEKFNAIVVVDITLQHIGSGTAVSAKWIDKDAVNGPFIQCFDASNNPTTGIVNVLIEGF